MKHAVIIVAAGKGLRFGGPTRKQYLEVAGKPIYIHTIEKFLAFDPEMQVILVLPSDASEPELNSITTQLETSFSRSISICRGGDSRFASVQNGLALINPHVEVIGVHDAVRPLVSVEVIQKCFTTAYSELAVVPAIAVKNSLRLITDTGNESVDRSVYRMIQTPQCFTKDVLLQSYNVEYQPLFTDDASVVESKGYKIKLVEGNPENIKITTPPDYVFAKYYLED